MPAERYATEKSSTIDWFAGIIQNNHNEKIEKQEKSGLAF